MRRKHGEKQYDEPWFEWERMRFPKIGEKIDPHRSEGEMELEAEARTDGDLLKSIPQLVCDFNVEVLKLGIGAKEERILLTAQSRMVAMMAQVAMKNDKVSDQMIALTRRIKWLTWGIFFIAIVTIGFMIFSYVQAK